MTGEKLNPVRPVSGQAGTEPPRHKVSRRVTLCFSVPPCRCGSMFTNLDSLLEKRTD